MALVIDVGMHKGEDTAFYLSRGHRVVAIDADPRMVERATQVFKDAVAQGRLTLLHAVITDKAGSTPFHLSERSEWSSLQKGVADREGHFKETIDVPAMRLEYVFHRFGIPHYCKIDIEGHDKVAVRSMALGHTPIYISCETEAAGDERLSEDQALETLTALVDKGYSAFKLVDQQRLLPLSMRQRVYSATPTPPLVRKFKQRIRWRGAYYYWLCARHQHRFRYGASGPFGEDLGGRWVNASAARELLLKHRRDYFSNPGAEPHGFWCDWHARM